MANWIRADYLVGLGTPWPLAAYLADSINAITGGGGGSVQIASKTYADLTAYATATAFTVTGTVRVVSVVGVVGAVGIESTSGVTILAVNWHTSNFPAFGLSATLDGSALVADAVWTNSDNTVPAATSSNADDVVSNGDSLDLAASDSDITQGSLTLYVLWEPVSDGATVVGDV